MVYIMENPIKMDDLGVPLFLETPMYFSLNSEAGFQTNLNYGAVILVEPKCMQFPEIVSFCGWPHLAFTW